MQLELRVSLTVTVCATICRTIIQPHFVSKRRDNLHCIWIQGKQCATTPSLWIIYTAKLPFTSTINPASGAFETTKDSKLALSLLATIKEAISCHEDNFLLGVVLLRRLRNYRWRTYLAWIERRPHSSFIPTCVTICLKFNCIMPAYPRSAVQRDFILRATACILLLRIESVLFGFMSTAVVADYSIAGVFKCGWIHALPRAYWFYPLKEILYLALLGWYFDTYFGSILGPRES